MAGCNGATKRTALSCSGRRDGAARHSASCTLEADVVRHVYVVIGIIEIEPVAVVREQLGPKAHHPRMIDMIEGAKVRRGVAREVLVIVRIVMPLEVIRSEEQTS